MRHELVTPSPPGHGWFRVRWLIASAFAALVSGCGAPDDAPPTSTRPDSQKESPSPDSGQRPDAAFVSAGGRAVSRKYVMDFVFGQSTQNQDQSTSTSYLARGGLIGGNGRAR